MTTPRIRRVPPRRSDAADQGAKSFFQPTVFQQPHRWSAHSSLLEAERSAQELRLQGFHAIARGSAL